MWSKLFLALAAYMVVSDAFHVFRQRCEGGCNTEHSDYLRRFHGTYNGEYDYRWVTRPQDPRTAKMPNYHVGERNYSYPTNGNMSVGKILLLGGPIAILLDINSSRHQIYSTDVLPLAPTNDSSTVVLLNLTRSGNMSIGFLALPPTVLQILPPGGLIAKPLDINSTRYEINCIHVKPLAPTNGSSTMVLLNLTRSGLMPTYHVGEHSYSYRTSGNMSIGLLALPPTVLQILLPGGPIAVLPDTNSTRHEIHYAPVRPLAPTNDSSTIVLLNLTRSEPIPEPPVQPSAALPQEVKPKRF